MNTPSQLSLAEFIARDEQKELLRFTTAGSVDDGKSTLIGRLLHDSKGIYEDQLASVRKASAGNFSAEGIDLALVTDGLKAEREQGITIDVAYRYFATPRRKFILADTPGHEQYTRNMATGASTANVAVVLVDARLGVLSQTKRHAFITSLLGIPHMIVAVNKMDLVGYAQEVFDRIREDMETFAAKLGVVDVRFIPISALLGDNVVARSSQMPWYTGESLLEVLENVHIASDHNLVDLRFPVQVVLRPDMNFRGYAGVVASGVLRKGDEILVLPTMKTTRVESIVTFDGELDEASPPMSITVTLAGHQDISRGDMLVHPHNLPRVERHFEAMLVWMNETPMDVHKPYLLKHTTRTTRARIDAVRYRVDVNTLHRTPSAPLGLNEIGRVVFTSHQPLFWDAYARNRATGGFILIDLLSNTTVAAGMLIDREPSDQLPAQTMEEARRAPGRPSSDQVGPEERIERLTQKPATIWLSGPTEAGAGELAYAVERRIFDLGGLAAVLVEADFPCGSDQGTGSVGPLCAAAVTLNQAGLIAICVPGTATVSQGAVVAERIGAEHFVEVVLPAGIAPDEAVSLVLGRLRELGLFPPRK